MKRKSQNWLGIRLVSSLHLKNLFLSKVVKIYAKADIKVTRLVQFSLIFLLFVKCFVNDCRFNKRFLIILETSSEELNEHNFWTTSWTLLIEEKTTSDSFERSDDILNPLRPISSLI